MTAICINIKGETTEIGREIEGKVHISAENWRRFHKALRQYGFKSFIIGEQNPYPKGVSSATMAKYLQAEQ